MLILVTDQGIVGINKLKIPACGIKDSSVASAPQSAILLTQKDDIIQIVSKCI